MNDAHLLLVWRNDPEVIRYSRHNIPQTDVVGHMKWVRSRVHGRHGEIYRVIETNDGIPVGLVWTTFDPDGDDVPEVHYRIDPWWRHRGIASTAVPIFIEQMVNVIRGGAFKCPIIKGNVPSEHLAARLGLHPGSEAPLSRDDPRVLVEWIK